MAEIKPESIRIAGAGGLELRMLKWSDEGTPVFLVHGFGNEAHIWDDFAPALASSADQSADQRRCRRNSSPEPKVTTQFLPSTAIPISEWREWTMLRW